MLARVDRMILGGASESEATVQISRLVAAHMGAVAGAVIVPGTVGNRAEAAYLQRADADEDRNDEEIPNDEGVAAVALRSRGTETSGNITSDVRYGERSRAIAKRVGFRSAAAAPILIGDEVVAALFVGFEGERDFDSETISALERLAAQAAIAIEHARQRENLEQLARETALALAGAIESRDSYTGHHCARLAEYAGDVARELGVERAVVERIRLGAALHDVGKISVPDAVLLKPERLTDEEFAIIQQHCRTGAELCRRISLGDEVLGIVASHHERYDGTGYPDGLAGDRIPLGARIVAVVDAYDAMTTTRPYRTAMPHNRAVEILRAGAGTQWDPQIVAAFLTTIEAMPEHEEHAA
jgi:putative nucleotidyltransferase with HDIG domain